MADTQSSPQPPRSLREELLRDTGGALLFGVPLVYTMEVWWIGQTTPLTNTAAVLVIAYLVSCAVRHAVADECSTSESLVDGLRGTLVSLVISWVLLVTLGILNLAASAAEMLGVVAAVSIPLTLGSALGSALFANPEERDGPDEDEGGNKPRRYSRDMVASLLGASFLALPIAPTEEVPLIASTLDPVRMIGTVILAWIVCNLVLFASGFLRYRNGPGTAQGVDALLVTSTVTTVGFVVVAGLLVATGQINSADPASRILGDIVALSIPAVIGAAAGRLAAA